MCTYPQEHLPRGDTARSGLGPLASVTGQENRLAHGQSGGGIFSIDVPSPQMAPACVKLGRNQTKNSPARTCPFAMGKQGTSTLRRNPSKPSRPASTPLVERPLHPTFTLGCIHTKVLLFPILSSLSRLCYTFCYDDLLALSCLPTDSSTSVSAQSRCHPALENLPQLLPSLHLHPLQGWLYSSPCSA